MRTTMVHNMTGAHARWAVLWIDPRGEWQVKEFENDFVGATEVYLKVKGKRRGATLLCRNVGFPPPEKLRPRVVGYKKRRRSSGQVEKVPVMRDPLETLNRNGWLWCPYCREMRQFKRKRGYFVDDIFVHEPNVQCPVCGITTENHHVRKHNPSLHQRTEVISNGSTKSARSRGTRSGSSKLTEEQRAAKRERAKRRREAKRGA